MLCDAQMWCFSTSAERRPGFLCPEGGGLLRTCALRPSGIYGPDERRHLYRVMVRRPRQQRGERGDTAPAESAQQNEFYPRCLHYWWCRRPVTSLVVPACRPHRGLEMVDLRRVFVVSKIEETELKFESQRNSEGKSSVPPSGQVM